MKHIQEQIERLRSYREGVAVADDFKGIANNMEALLRVAETANIYRKHMTEQIEPVQACGMRLDEALEELQKT